MPTATGSREVDRAAAALGAGAGMTAVEFVEAVLACHKGGNE